MLREKWWNITITYPNHTKLTDYVEIPKIAKSLTPKLKAISEDIKSGQISHIAYPLVRLSRNTHIAIYVNPHVSDIPYLVFCDSKTNTYSTTIPHAQFLELKKQATKFEFEDKCRGIAAGKYKCYMNPQMTKRMEQALLEDTKDPEPEFE